MSSLLRRWTHIVAALIVGGGLLTGLYVLGSGGAHAADDEDNQAEIIVQFNDSRSVIRPITFTTPISGLKALELSGLDVVTQEFSFGALICSIEGVGCPADDCSCGGTRFWGNNYWDGSAWQFYPIGASSTVISQTGAIDGWLWGEFGDLQTPATQTLAAQAGLGFVAAQQVITDGSYVQSVPASVDAMLAIGANGLAAGEWRGSADAPSVLDFVALNGASYARHGVAEAGKLAVAMTGAEGCWPPRAPEPSDYFSPTLGAMSDQAGFLAWGILGSVALSESVPAGNIDFLKGLAQTNGGWEWNEGFGTDTNATALAIQALVAAGESISSSTVVSGLAYLHGAQNSDGGFPYSPDSSFGTDSDTNSTAWVVQAIYAVGQDPAAPEWTQGSANAISFMLALQQDDGSIEWMPGAPVGTRLSATEQAIAGLLGQPNPYAVKPLEVCDIERVFLPLL